MYTGYYFKHSHLYGPDGSTDYDLADGLIQKSAKEPTGYYVSNGRGHVVQHIFGPEGYTRFYIQDGYLYGPVKSPPWLRVPEHVDSC